MAVIFDTAELPDRDRLDAFCSMVVDNTVPSTVVLKPHAAGRRLKGRLASWELGATQAIRTSVNHLMDLQRSPRQTRRGALPMISVAVPGSVSRYEQFGIRHTTLPGSMVCVDLSSPYRMMQASENDGYALQIPIDALDLPMDTIQHGAPNLGRSPLYHLMTSHLVAVTRDPGQFPDPQVAASIGRSSIELARALLLSAAGADSEPASGSALITQVQTYAGQHLANPQLGPDLIAAALNMSVRHLYAVCARHDFSIEQWIISRRLERAKGDLADPAHREATVAAIARRHGFRSAAHFSRRFRAAYDVTPTDWRQSTTSA